MSYKANLVVLSGAGISAESGPKTFRDSDGLWEGYRVEQVATPEAWVRDKQAVLKFYNERRLSVKNAVPNKAHILLAELQSKYDGTIITQNIDDLHERAGSKNVIHLHGEIFKARSTSNPEIIIDIIGTELNLGDKCELGSQLRPHIVWFGEAVPMMQAAIEKGQKADIFLVIGTSLAVYPAAGLVDFVQNDALKFLVDPNSPLSMAQSGFKILQNKATIGMQELYDLLLQSY